MATRPGYTFHSSYSYLYYRILSCYMLSSCTFHILSSCTIRILHIHLYVQILSYTLCFRILSVLFLCWLKANTFISYLYFSYYVNIYLIFHISEYKTYTFTIISYTVICFHICFHVRSYSVLSYHILSSYTFYLFICVFIYSYHLRIPVIHSSLCIAFSGISYFITYPCMLCYALDSLYSLIRLL